MQSKIMATKIDVEYVIEKTRIMCDQFNFAVHDLRNQVDTTDSYIENYLPLKHVKEITSLLQGSLDPDTYEKVQQYESIKIKELYARLITQLHVVPDFKTRLIELQQKFDCDTSVRGLGQGTRPDGKVLRVSIAKTPGWLQEVSTKNDFEAVLPDSGQPIAEGDYWQEEAQKNPRQFKPLFDAKINTEPLEKLTKYFVKVQGQSNYRLNDKYNVFKERWPNEEDNEAE